MSDEAYMARALRLAALGRGWTNPNPMVGAIIVSGTHVLAEGYHHRYGDLHAECDALKNAMRKGLDVCGATMYVTLEPCCHFGRQPPCTDAIIEAGITRVVIGSSDPNPKVAGQGIGILREAGIEVSEGVLADECLALNEAFLTYIQTGRPLVTMKYAMTIDGKIACVTGESRWITGEGARRHVHEQRHAAAAIMVGVGTIITDNPQLTSRIEGGNDPVRIVCDTHLRTPLDARVVTSARRVPTLIATCESDPDKHRPFTAAGCQIAILPNRNGHVDLVSLVNELGNRNLDSLIIEGGATLNWSALQAGIVDKVQAYIAPKIFGGMLAKGPVGGPGFTTPADAIELTDVRLTRIGDDHLIEGRILPCSRESSKR